MRLEDVIGEVPSGQHVVDDQGDGEEAKLAAAIPDDAEPGVLCDEVLRFHKHVLLAHDRRGGRGFLRRAGWAGGASPAPSSYGRGVPSVGVRAHCSSSVRSSSDSRPSR